MQLIKLESNEILSERSKSLDLWSDYSPDRAYQYTVQILSNKNRHEYSHLAYVHGDFWVDNFFLDRFITAKSAQEAQLKAAEEVYKQFLPIITPRVPARFKVQKYADLGYSNTEIMELINKNVVSPEADKRADRRDSRMNEQFIRLRVDLNGDNDIKIQYPEIHAAHERIRGQHQVEFPLIVRMYNDYGKAGKSDSYKGLSFEEAISTDPFWWEIELDPMIQQAYPNIINLDYFDSLSKVDGIVYHINSTREKQYAAREKCEVQYLT